MRLLLSITLLALGGCGSETKDAPGALPLGVWRVDNPEDAAEMLLPVWRTFTTTLPAADVERLERTGAPFPVDMKKRVRRSDEEILAFLVPYLSASSIAFDKGGRWASMNSGKVEGSGRWRLEGDTVVLESDRSGATGEAVNLEEMRQLVHIRGGELFMVVFDVEVRLKRDTK